MQLDLSMCTDEDIEVTIQNLQTVLSNRKQVALRAFRKENPVLGYAYQDEGTWSGFWEEMNSTNIKERALALNDVPTFIMMPVRNEELKRLLATGNMVHFPEELNVASTSDDKSEWTPWKK